MVRWLMGKIAALVSHEFGHSFDIEVDTLNRASLGTCRIVLETVTYLISGVHILNSIPKSSCMT